MPVLGFPTQRVSPGATASALVVGEPLDVHYLFEGKSQSVADFARRTDTTTPIHGRRA